MTKMNTKIAKTNTKMVIMNTRMVKTNTRVVRTNIKMVKTDTKMVRTKIDQSGYDGYQNGYYENYQSPVKFDRPIVVKPVEKPKNQQDFSKIPGVAGVDYPLYHTVPKTSFSCAYVPFVPGMYANVETGCQVIYFIYILCGSLVLSLSTKYLSPMKI